MTYHTRTLPHAMHTAPRYGTTGPQQIIAGWWRAYWSGRARRATAHILRGLDDRTLHDIGIQRSEIDSVVYANPSDRLRHFRHELR